MGLLTRHISKGSKIFVKFVPGEFENLEEFKERVLRINGRVKKRPLLIVFNEFILGTANIVNRRETKHAIAEISRALAPNTYVFFSIGEKTGKNQKHFSNTGYIIEPAVCGKPKWKAYPKLFFYYDGRREMMYVARADEEALKKASDKKQREFEGMLVHWYRRTCKWFKWKKDLKEGFFPEIEINGQRVRFVVCADLKYEPAVRKADVIVTSSRGLRIDALGKKLLIMQAKPGAKILVSDVLHKGPVKYYRGKRNKPMEKRLGVRRIHRI
ncbi:MAG: hypothetical protein J7L44_01575 [Candidatus Diapherotrites archaeon]|nr:hypothetical protein [Candidatus Diapherotrites archaeon]